MKNQIFISYRRIGGAAMAYLLKEELEAQGYLVFLDITSPLSPGRFDEKLRQEIDNCMDFILILSPNALDRCVDSTDVVRLEIGYALKQKKNIIPVFLEGYENPDKLPDDIKDDALRYSGPHGYFNFQAFNIYMKNLRMLLTCHTKSEHESEVLVWGDVDKVILRKLLNKLDSNFLFTIINRPLEIRRYDLKTIHAVLLINTNVSKLAINEETRKLLDEHLSTFVYNGGILLGTHDIIYCRTQNKELQNAFGCTTTDFVRFDEAVEYKKTDECIRLNVFSDLADKFSLADGEICWGSLKEDTTVYFKCTNGRQAKDVPLVFSRAHGDGICFWFNTGDFRNDCPPKSIREADDNLVLLINEVLRWKRRKDYQNIKHIS